MDFKLGEKMNIVLHIPNEDEGGYIQLQRDVVQWRARVAELNPARDVEFWDALAEFIAQHFIVEPADPDKRIAAAKQLSRKQFKQILDYLAGKETPEPPLSS